MRETLNTSNDRITAKMSRRDFLAATGISGVEAIQASKTGHGRATPRFRFAAAFPPLAEHLFLDLRCGLSGQQNGLL